MKKICILLTVIIGLISCENRDVDFPDFDYTTGYFPYQYPVRTIVLGNYVYDNENDNNHKFVISAAMGGVYNNKKDRLLDFIIDESLCKNATFSSTGEPILLLPPNYYTLSNTQQITIPSGSFNGGVEVQLSEDFFNDPLAIKNSYVLPLRITNVTNLDSLHEAKNFTMFAVKFVNPYHGKYLHYGACEVKDLQGNKVDEVIYSTTYIEQNEIWNLVTTGRKAITVNGSFKSEEMPGFFTMTFNFETDVYDTQGGVSCTIKESADSEYSITGEGKYVIDAEEYGNKKRDAIYVSYEIRDGSHIYSAKDTLVMRDKAVVMEVFTPVVN